MRGHTKWSTRTEDHIKENRDGALVLLSVETSGVWHPGGGVVEVEAAGAVEGLLGGAGGGAAGQDVVFVVVVAGAGEGGGPAGGRARGGPPGQRGGPARRRGPRRG